MVGDWWVNDGICGYIHIYIHTYIIHIYICMDLRENDGKMMGSKGKFAK